MFFEAHYDKLFFGKNMEEKTLKKRTFLVAVTALSLTLLTACGGNKQSAAETEYFDKMNNFFESVKTLDTEINALDPEDTDSISQLFVYLEELESQFKYLSEIDAPSEFDATESLADEAYDYMVQATDYFAQSFTDNSYNEYTYAAGLECYKRANKRVQYIIALIHGEDITDENVTVE